MKKFYSLLFAFVAAVGLSAQTNLLENGDFETWTDGQPDNWKTASTASNATLTQSTDAHGGQYAVAVGGAASSNKRMGYKEITLEAGTYAMSFWAKGGDARPGYVPVTDGQAGTYVYGNYANGNEDWTLVSYEFELTATTTLSLVVMNPKSNKGNPVLIDDFSLTLKEEAPVDPDPVDPDPVDPDPNPADIAGTGEGTVASPYDVTRALSLIENKANDASAEVYIAGKISTITEISTQYKNATYYIADASGKEINVFRGKFLKGADFTSEDQIKVGDEVIICGKLVLYVPVNGGESKPQVNTGSSIYSLNGKTEAEGGDPVDPTPVDPTPGSDFCTIVGNTTTAIFGNAGLENAADATTFNLTDGTTITFGQGEGNNAPKYYTSGAAIRMYALNTISIAAEKEIASVTISHVASYGGNETLTATPGTLSRDAEKNTITLSGVNAKNVTVANNHVENKGGTQLRVVSIAVTYVNTGIEAIGSQQKAGAAYDLSGRRVNAAKKGLYIIGGKKVLVK